MLQFTITDTIVFLYGWWCLFICLFIYLHLLLPIFFQLHVFCFFDWMLTSVVFWSGKMTETSFPSAILYFSILHRHTYSLSPSNSLISHSFSPSFWYAFKLPLLVLLQQSGESHKNPEILFFRFPLCSGIYGKSLSLFAALNWL